MSINSNEKWTLHTKDPKGWTFNIIGLWIHWYIDVRKPKVQRLEMDNETSFVIRSLLVLSWSIRVKILKSSKCSVWSSVSTWQDNDYTTIWLNLWKFKSRHVLGNTFEILRYDRNNENLIQDLDEHPRVVKSFYDKLRKKTLWSVYEGSYQS